MTDKVTWPLFWCLESTSQVSLIQWQWDNYGVKIEPLKQAANVSLDVEEDNLEEIDKFMCQAPSRSRGKNG